MKILNNRKAWFVLLFGLAVTLIATAYITLEINKKEEAEFRYESKNIAGRIESRLQKHALILRSCAAFFVGSDFVSREDWRDFIQQYNIEENLPGVMGLGFTLKIPRNQLQEHIKEIRSQGFPDYVVWPEKERDVYTSIIYLEPFTAKGLRTFGFDMMTEPVRGEAMELARDMNVAALSGKVRLVQEAKTEEHAGNVMYVPVYQRGASIETVNQRRAALKGWVYMSSRLDDLMAGILPDWESENTHTHQHYLSIYDGTTVSSESLLFESHDTTNQIKAENKRLTLNSIVDFNGHKWTLLIRQERGNIFSDYLSAWIVFIGGSIISVLLFLLSRSMINTQYKAHKIAEALTVELKESENRLRKIMEVSPVPLILSKLNNKEVVIANEAFGNLFKISTPETIGQEMSDFYAIETDRDALLEAVLEDGYVDNAELQLIKSDGEIFWCSMSLKLLTLDDEQVLIKAFHDITQRKKAEEEITRHREHLERMVTERTEKLTISEQKLLQSIKEISDYKLALDQSSSVTIADSDGIITEVNESHCKTSKYSREELIGKSHKISNSGFHPKEFFTDLWNTITEGKIWRGEVKNKAKDGSFYWVDTTIVPFLDENEKPYQYVSIRFDITDRKSIETDLIEAKKVADAANLAKTQFLANMSHEIRTPMNAVIGFSELLAKSVQDKKQLSQVESIRSSGKNLLNIINDLLDLSKIEAGKLEFLPRPVKLSNILSEIENVFAEKVKEKGITLSIDYKNALPKTLLLDEVRLRQILFNLIGNAVKFTDEGFVYINIEDKKSSENKEMVDLTIIVKDTGIGIPADQQELIFHPFNQMSGQNHIKFGGTGLGLSISKKLVEKMGGSISLESEDGKGSMFRVTLPNIPISDSEVAVKEKAFDSSKVIFKPATILVADDHEENLKLISDLLANSPLTILQAKNGEEAVAMAQKHLPNLILMDLKMPIMDGYEAARILKALPTTKSIPIMALTASIKNNGEKDMMEKAFDEYLLKPLDIAQLFEKLKKTLKFKVVEADKPADTYVSGNPKYTYSEEIKEHIPGFIKTLEVDFMAEYKRIIKNQVINEIEKFGLDLLEKSEEMHCDRLIEYSNELIVYAESFDFEKLLQTLRKFPGLVKWLKAETKDAL